MAKSIVIEDAARTGSGVLKPPYPKKKDGQNVPATMVKAFVKWSLQATFHRPQSALITGISGLIHRAARVCRTEAIHGNVNMRQLGKSETWLICLGTTVRQSSQR